MGYMENVMGIPTLNVENENDVAGYTLIDVRREEEFCAELGHIEGATLKTLGDSLENYLESASKDQKILFICRSGGRSAQATQMALQMGFEDAYNMAGGMLYWNSQNFKVHK
jgi:rhodanese-related sulfurtransferase